MRPVGRRRAGRARRRPGLGRERREPPRPGAGPDGDPQERIAWAEDRYADGDLDAAVSALHDVAHDPDVDDPVRAQANADLAVIAFGLGEVRVAKDAGRAALALEPEQPAALEALASCAEADGDHLQAAHWTARLARTTPEDPGPWRDLGRFEVEGARWDRAVEALDRAADLAPLPAREELLRRRALEALAAEQAPAPEVPAVRVGAERPRVLVCVDYFFPSVGGLEHIAEGVGVALRELGWTVEVACRHLPERESLVRRGLTIHEVRDRPREELRRIVRRGHYDAVLAFSDPYAWPVPAVLRLPRPGPRLVVVPCVTANADRWVREIANLPLWRELLDNADVVVHNSEHGWDAKLNRDMGVPGVYVPQAVVEHAPAPGDLRAEHGIGPDEHLLLYVANLHPHKNHAGLLEALADRPGSWRLLLAGRPTAANPEEAVRVAELAARDPRVVLAGGLSPAGVAAALRTADLFLCPSDSDAVPLIVQEAMCAGLPWIATPAAGAVHDWAGGLILPVADFGPGIDHLLAEPDARAALGRHGRAHWEACFHYGVASRCYDALLRGASHPPAFPAPAAALEGTDAIRAEAYDALVPSARQLVGA